MTRAIHLITAVLLGLALPVAAQDDENCTALDKRTLFCGRDAGWIEAADQPIPGTTSFQNEAYLFAVATQADHGQVVTPVLYDIAIEGLLLEMDRRADAPAGTHEAEFIDVIDKGGIEGRRLSVLTEVDGQPVRNIMDIYFSDAHAWTAQTGHLGPIPLDRLLKVHGLVMEELHLEW